MAIPFTPQDVASGFNLTKLNQNFDNTQTALQDALSRSGQGPNQMEADIDLNNNDLLNVNQTKTNELFINGALVTPDALQTIPSSIMLKGVYDPQGIEGDAFDLNSHTGSIATIQIEDNAVTNSKLADVATATIKGRNTTGTGSPEDLTVDEAVSVLGLTYIKDIFSGTKAVQLRKFRSTFVDPSDWTSTLQAAADSGEPTIRVHGDAEVTFDDQWACDTDGQKWIGESMDNKAQLRRTTVVDEPAILFRGERQGMRHIGVKCNSNVGVTASNFGIFVARPAGELADLDFEFRDGYISGWFYGIGNSGRGLTVANSLISDVRYGVNFDWPADGTYIEGSNNAQKKATGFRRLKVDGCEFHSIEVAAVRNRGANAANAHLVIENNYSNFGKGMFAGLLGDGSIIRNNHITYADFDAFQIDGGTNWYMINNCVTGTRVTSPSIVVEPPSFIKMVGTNTGFIIDGFKGTYCIGHGIDARDGDFKGILRNIDLNEIGSAGVATSDGVIFIGTGANTEVLVDGVTLRSAATARSVVRMNTAASVLKHRAIVALGAATPATSGSGTFTPV